MGRGLSKEQNEALALAWRINRLHGMPIEQGETKPDNFLYRKRKQCMNSNGTPQLYSVVSRQCGLHEYDSQVFMHILYGIQFTDRYEHPSGSTVLHSSIERRSKESKSSCAAVARTSRRLTDRQLMQLAQHKDGNLRTILTPAGAAIGSEYQCDAVATVSDDYLLQCLVVADCFGWRKAIFEQCSIEGWYARTIVPDRDLTFADWFVASVRDKERSKAAEWLSGKQVREYFQSMAESIG